MRRCEQRGTFARAWTVATIVTMLVYIASDTLIAVGHLRAPALPATLGFILLGAALLAGGCALAVHVAIAIGRHIPRASMRALGASVVVWYPAQWVAAAMTEGSGVSRSGWAPALRIVVIAGLLLAAAAAGGMLPRLEGRVSGRVRVTIAVAIVACGLGALAVTSFHAITYVHAHRGILVISAILLQIGIAFTIGRRADVRGVRRLLAPLIVAGTAMLGLGLSRIGGPQRAAASYTIFAHTLVAQKLQPLLLRASPVFRSTARVDLGATRLLATNVAPVPPLARGAYRGKNLLLVTFDAVRADIVAKTLHGHAVAPNLQAFAAQSVSFRHAVANYSHTNRSILSILSGSWQVRFPSEQYVSADPIDVHARTRLPRVFQDAGYETIAIMMSGRWGEEFFDNRRLPAFERHVPAGEHCEDQVAAFQRFLAERTNARPFLAWVHIFDTHTPLRSERIDQMFGDSLTAQYAAAVHYADRCFGELVAALQRVGEWHDTIVVVSADHGEALGEHGRTLQHSTCYWHDIHIPLIIRFPDARAATVEFPIQLADLAPTLANMLGIHLQEPEVDGDDLSGVLAASPPVARGDSPAGMVFTQGHAQQYRCASVVSGRWHLIYTEAARSYELYDVDTDPREERNLIAERPEIFVALQPVLDAFRERAARRPR